MKKVLRYGGAGFLIALAYLGWVMLQRHNANQEYERAAAESETARYKKLVPANTELKITQFYASKQVAASGESVLVCYGVENAHSVRIEPPIEDHLIPLPAKCIPFAPHRTTTLKLVAESDKGGEATESITVKVR